MDAKITDARIRKNIYKALPAKLKPLRPDTFVPFPEFYVKIENGFVAQKNCFVARVPTKQNQKANDFKHLYRPLNQFDRSLADATPHSNAKAVHFDEPNAACADSLDGAQLLLDCALPFNLNRGGLVVGNGHFDPGKQRTNRRPAGSTIRSSTRSDRSPEMDVDGRTPAKSSAGEICGAMSEQHGQGGRSDQSAPQKFVHLVGCRDANAPPRPGVRPRPVHRKP
jgi:hypothetical protein